MYYISQCDGIFCISQRPCFKQMVCSQICIILHAVGRLVSGCSHSRSSATRISSINNNLLERLFGLKGLVNFYLVNFYMDEWLCL